jgi:hypothetical protein
MFLLIKYIHLKLNYLGYISSNDKLDYIQSKLLDVTNHISTKFIT